ncbi:chromosome segregation protein SMC [Tropicimonas sp. IMCC6043]|uniref:chromosome segregation protein SMC n=1 Tax=Tropicimonas sp. IMCC6043 TaxID=2510645 RepID=UPI00101BD034|nr:chromosome segregation protein SMC [Tropicimonas sp. IMCC6043]RYH11651.1 chromosome segregation protein SMC [Tropicimonas sp. IMCC6043]
MRFSRLRLNGFKSFVDPTELVIADGLTGVVGPNGCGKSNLLEALRWVMGENRPTAMRGGGMEDVIFAGAASRPARNFAEVCLMIDNSERLAPSGFNEADSLEIIRRITRDVGSAYKANARDVRARDIQMLFADASTGSQSPALVRQGQISELINAKPKNRRRILEEAAGISGLYQRRHEAELKLNAAEQNLARVDDVIEQLAGQLAQLARQAKQAERYRTIGAELRRAEGLLLYRRWREASDALEAARTELRERMTAAAKAERLAVETARRRETADEALPPLREEEAIAAAVLQRLQVELGAIGEEENRARNSIATLERQILQMAQDVEREAGLNRDAGETIARLAQERDALATETEGHAEALAAAVEAARIAASNLQGRESDLAALTEDVARLAARHQSAERMETDATQAVSRHEQEARSAQAVVEQASGVLSGSTEALELAEAGLEAATLMAEEAEATLAEADTARADCAAREAEARAEHSAAEGEAQALRAEVAALARLVERDASEGDQVMDRIRVDFGFEKALGAALADDLRAPEIGSEAVGSGWAPLPPYEAAQSLPDGVESLAERMDVPGVLGRRMAQVGLVAATDGPRLQAALKPGQRLVSPEGDLWRWDGFRAAAADAPSAAALRLQQLNRLVALKRDLEDAAARSEGAAHAHALLHRQLQELSEADRAARQARKDADTALAAASRALSRAENERAMAETRLEAAELAVARHRDEAESARERLEEARAARAELADLSEARLGIETAKAQVEGSRRDMMAARAAQDELRRLGEARERRLKEIARDIDGWQKRLDNAEARSADLEARKEAAMEDLEIARAAPEEIAVRKEKLTVGLEAAEARRRAAADALAAAETVFREAERAERDAEKFAGHAREARAASEARAEAAQEVLDGAVSWIREELETTPEALLEALDADPETMPSMEAIEADIARLRRGRDALGAVNLRAEEDAKEVAGEHAALVEEKRDLQEAIRALRGGIASLNREGRERLLTAFEEVNGNFRLLFTHLFGGGEAKLELVESDDPLEAGLEIMCMPPGKKLSTLSLLSGGEQTLTALALIFAVFLANPAPICVLDEVDAPLDDANVTRFCDLLDEMVNRADTRFLIITHHAVTMSRMDRLFGVTMQEQGVSQLVSVDLKKAEALVA